MKLLLVVKIKQTRYDVVMNQLYRSWEALTVYLFSVFVLS